MQGFSGQVAGHGSLFNGEKKGTLLKVFDSREFLFYYNVYKTKNLFQDITCTFHGLLEMKNGTPREIDPDIVAESYRCYWDKPAVRVPDMFIVIDNLTEGMTRPCMMDVKLGRREHDLWTGDTKREYLTKKCMESTSHEYSIRYCGRIVWEHDDTHKNEYKQIKSSKLEGRTTDIKIVEKNIVSFFDYAGDKKEETVKAAIENLKVMRKVFEEQNLYMIYSSSVLFVYDAANPGLCRVKLIDFAHAVDKILITDSDEKGVDRDLVDGVAILTSILEKSVGKSDDC